MASFGWCRHSLLDGERKFAMIVETQDKKTEPVTRRAVRVDSFHTSDGEEFESENRSAKSRRTGPVVRDR